MSNLIQSIIKNDLDAAKTVIINSLNEKAKEAIELKKQEIASQFFTKVD